jgi:hypothetical protein
MRNLNGDAAVVRPASSLPSTGQFKVKTICQADESVSSELALRKTPVSNDPFESKLIVRRSQWLDRPA